MDSKLQEYAKLIQALDIMAALRPDHIRRGQALFNALHELRPYIADVIRTTAADPFYRDDKIPDFYEAIAIEMGITP